MERFITTVLKGVSAYKNIEYITIIRQTLEWETRYKCELCNTFSMSERTTISHCGGGKHIARYAELRSLQDGYAPTTLYADYCKKYLTNVKKCQALLAKCPPNFPSARTTLQSLCYEYITSSDSGTAALTLIKNALVKFIRRDTLALLELSVIQFLAKKTFTIGGIDEARVQQTINPGFRFSRFLQDLRIGDVHIIVSLVACFVK